MLKHYVIFTFEDNFFHDNNLEEFNQVFDEIKHAIDGVKDVHIRMNCIDRPANMDLMVEMDLTDESVLPQYLNFPAHVAMGKKYNPHVTNRVSFDYKY